MSFTSAVISSAILAIVLQCFVRGSVADAVDFEDHPGERQGRLTVYLVLDQNSTQDELAQVGTMIQKCVAKSAPRRAGRALWNAQRGERIARRRGARDRHHARRRPRPSYHHEPQYPAHQSDDGGAKKLLLGIIPGFLAVGGLLGFGLSALFFDKEPDNAINFNPNISYNGDNITFTVIDTDTITNTNSQSQTASASNVITNTDTNTIDTSVIPVVINTDVMALVWTRTVLCLDLLSKLLLSGILACNYQPLLSRRTLRLQEDQGPSGSNLHHVYEQPPGWVQLNRTFEDQHSQLWTKEQATDLLPNFYPESGYFESYRIEDEGHAAPEDTGEVSRTPAYYDFEEYLDFRDVPKVLPDVLPTASQMEDRQSWEPAPTFDYGYIDADVWMVDNAELNAEIAYAPLPEELGHNDHIKEMISDLFANHHRDIPLELNSGITEAPAQKRRFKPTLPPKHSRPHLPRLPTRPRLRPPRKRYPTKQKRKPAPRPKAPHLRTMGRFPHPNFKAPPLKHASKLPPHRRYSPPPPAPFWTTNAFSFLTSALPAFLTIGSFLGFGLGALSFEPQPDTVINFNPNFTVNGANFSFSSTNSDTIQNSNSESQSSSSSNTISNTDVTIINNTVIPININTEGKTMSSLRPPTLT
eukprot:maker-scaffold857_size87770-snap-gene-0.25 protein:Tk01675 transcript:maker-scaffold857_size87770-snap-gene-0.25-mRNA-1 annotation:"PREDICTED: titin"